MDTEEPIVEHIGIVHPPPTPQTFPPALPAQGGIPLDPDGDPPIEEFIGIVGILIFVDTRRLS